MDREFPGAELAGLVLGVPAPGLCSACPHTQIFSVVVIFMPLS
jgi:TPP-dependent indolepyruvate ferredoxin oxidoreductase alpha subunit